MKCKKKYFGLIHDFWLCMIDMYLCFTLQQSHDQRQEMAAAAGGMQDNSIVGNSQIIINNPPMLDSAKRKGRKVSILWYQSYCFYNTQISVFDLWKVVKQELDLFNNKAFLFISRLTFAFFTLKFYEWWTLEHLIWVGFGKENIQEKLYSLYLCIRNLLLFKIHSPAQYHEHYCKLADNPTAGAI